MRLLCIGRHPILSGHISRYFEGLGLDVVTAVGLEEALRLVFATAPDVALCDYELLSLQPLRSWLRDPVASEVPLLAVSLTRRPDEMLLEPGQVAGSLYLPLLPPEDALAVLRHAASRGGVAIPAGATYLARGARLGIATSSASTSSVSGVQ